MTKLLNGSILIYKYVRKTNHVQIMLNHMSSDHMFSLQLLVSASASYLHTANVLFINSFIVENIHIATVAVAHVPQKSHVIKNERLG